MQSTVYLSWTPGDLNPADCLPRIDSEWAGSISAAERGALDRFQVLTAYDSLPTPVWIVGFRKGREGFFRNLSAGSLGAAGFIPVFGGGVPHVRIPTWFTTGISAGEWAATAHKPICE